MKKYVLFVFIILISISLVKAQSAMAKLKYEDAEEAYLNQDYALTLSKLADAETILKSTNPRILYLKVMARCKIISLKPYESYAFLASTRTLATQYLKSYESLPNNEDKYRAIYKESEKLSQYPNSAAAFAEKIAAAKQEEIDRQKLEAARLAHPKIFVDSLVELYKFKSGLTEAEFMLYNPVVAKIMTKKNFNKGVNPGSNFYFTNEQMVTLNKEGKVADLTTTLVCGESEQKRSAYQQYKSLIIDNLHDSERYEYNGQGMHFYAAWLPGHSLILTVHYTSSGCVYLSFTGIPMGEAEAFKKKTFAAPGFEYEKQ